MRIFYFIRISCHRITVFEILLGIQGRATFVVAFVSKHMRLQLLLMRRNVKNPHTVCTKIFRDPDLGVASLVTMVKILSFTF